MRIRSAPLAIVLGAMTAHCSLLAPSDAELMGGKQSTDAGASHDAAGDAPKDGGEGGSSCGQEAANCAGPGDCCAGLACETTAGICIPCTTSGGACFPTGDNTCCSGSCTGHKCD